MKNCLHCGEKSSGDFCCIGCREIHAALSENGLLSFYEYGEGTRPKPKTSFDARLNSCVVEEGSTATATWFLDGLHCQSCVWLLNQLPERIEDVNETQVDLRGQRLTFSFDSKRSDTALRDTHDWLQRFGYIPLATENGDRRRSPWSTVGIAWFFAANVMSLTIAFYAGLDFESAPQLASFVAAAIMLLTIGSISVGRTIFIRGFASLLSFGTTRTVSIDLPIAIGMTVAFCYSVYGVATQNTDAMWFDSIAVIVAALLSSRALNATISKDVSAFTRVDTKPIPSQTHRLIDDRLVVTDVAILQRGDVVSLDAGEVVPCDGKIDALSEVDRSAFSGESEPVWVPQGGQVFAGEIAISPLRVTVESVGDETQIAELISSLDAPLSARLLDRTDAVAARFTVVVLFAALGAFALGFADGTSLARAVSVLLVACPCAVAMAAPLGFSAALARLRRDGILVRDAATLESLAGAETVVFDKTGTVTTGNFKLHAFNTVSTFDHDWVFDAVCALEQQTSHPIASAFPKTQTAASNVEHVPFGIQGVVGGKLVLVSRSESEHTGLAVFVNGSLAAQVVIGDEVRPEFGTISDNISVPLLLLSGDREENVERVAKWVGVERFWAGKTAQEKQEIIRTLPRPVIYVGDGLNDVAALREADVGISVRNGHTSNLRHSDVAFVSGGIDDVVALVEHSRSAIRTLKIALGVSLFYNATAVAASMFGFVTPLVAAISMPISSTAVVFLASTLLRRKR